MGSNVGESKKEIECGICLDPPYFEIWDSIVSTAYGAYLDHAYAQNLAKPPLYAHLSRI